MEYITKDSGDKVVFESGMNRNTEANRPRFDLIIPDGQRFDETILYRLAMLLVRGASIYGERNWEKAQSEKELKRFKSSAFRHFMQWYCGEEDEDHVAAVLFNMNAYEFVKNKAGNQAFTITTCAVGSGEVSNA